MMTRDEQGNWYAVVTFGAPTRHTIAMLGSPYRTGRRVSRDLDEVMARAVALRPHVSDVRVVACSTREEARRADISDRNAVVHVY